MSVLDRAVPTAEEVSLESAPPTRRFTPTSWLVVIATIAGFGASVVWTDWASSILAGAAAGGFVGLAALSKTFGTRFDASRRSTVQLLSTAAIVGLLVGLGTALAGDQESSWSLLAGFAVVWFSAGRVAARGSGGLPSVDRNAGSGVTSRRHQRLLEAGAAVVCGAAVVSIFVADIARDVAIIALALPVAFALFWMSDRSDDATVSTNAISAGLAGVAAVALASIGVADRVGTAGIVLLALAAALTTVLVRFGRVVDRHLDRVGALTGSAALDAARLGALAVVCGVGIRSAVVVALLVAARAYSTRRADKPLVVADSSSTRARYAVAALTVVGFVLRVYTGRGLWLDETTSVFQAKMPFVDMIRFIGETDNHPPLHYIVLWAGVRGIGDSEFALRLPMMLMGVALIPVLYLLGREFFNRRVGVYAAALGTFAPIAVWYGQEARMYSQFMLLAALSTYGLVRILKAGQKRYWALYVLANVAVIYTQYFAVLHAGATFVVLFIEIARRYRDGRARSLLRATVGAAIAHVVMLAPLIPYALAQAARNQEEGFGFSTSGITAGSDVVPPPGIYGFLTNLQWIFFGYLPDVVSIRLVALWPIAMLILLLMLGTPRRTANRILLTVAGVPMIVIFATSFIAAQSRSLAEVRYFAGAVPVMFVLLAAGLVSIVRTRRLQSAVLGVTIGLMTVALIVQQVDRDNPRLYEYQEAVEQIRDDAQPGDQVLYAPQYFNYTLDYYDPTIPSAPLEEGLPIAADSDHSIFLVEAVSFADSDIAEREVDAAIVDLVERGMTIDARYEFAQITVWKIGPAT